MAETTQSNVHALKGDVTFDTVPKIWREISALLAGNGVLVVDLAAVKRADSSALALLIGWLRHARQAGKTIEFRNIPENLLAIARVTGVEALLVPDTPPNG